MGCLFVRAWYGGVVGIMGVSYCELYTRSCVQASSAKVVM